MKDLWTSLRPALVLFALLSLITGIVYPLAVTGLAQAAMPSQASGSLLVAGGTVVGSALVGQSFTDPGHFWGRPSAVGYDARTSSGSNQGPSNPALTEAVTARVAALRALDPDNQAPVPADLVTASGSGLDPHITPAAAYYQVARIARLRAMSPDQVRALVDRHIEEPTLGFLGERRVSVLQLNRELDRAAGGTPPPPATPSK